MKIYIVIFCYYQNIYYICTDFIISMNKQEGYEYAKENGLVPDRGRYILMYDDVYTNKKLNSNEKLILSLIISYTDKGCEFFATNLYIGELLNLSQPTVTKAIHSLYKLGYIKAYFKSRDATKSIVNRTIEPAGKYYLKEVEREENCIYKQIKYDGTDFKSYQAFQP